MTTTRRNIGSAVYHYGRRAFPVVVSVGLVTWLVWTVSPQKLAQALATSAWPWLLLASVVQLIVLFTWDTVSLWWLFSQPDRRLPFHQVFRARTDSVLWSAVNLEIGQGVFAWKIAEIRGESLTAALGRCMVLAVFDLGTLHALALIGSFVKPEPLTAALRWVCVAVVLGLSVLVVLLRFMPARWKQWLTNRDWAQWLRWWTWRHSFLLGAQRLIMFLLMLVYAGVGLAICRIPTDVCTVVGVIPFVLIAESLPGTGGLGERETALVYLLHPAGDQRAVLLSFGLIWSTVIILGRVTIGLASSWLPRAVRRAGEDRSEPRAVAQTSR